MALYPPGFLDDIRARLSVSSVVGKRVKLHKRGREYVGLSPFSTESTPSFTVNDQKGFYHCFSTGKHGDIFSFVMETQNLSFPDAIEQLARDAGLEIPQPSKEAQQKVQVTRKLSDLMDAACTFFQDALEGSQGYEALTYLKQRGLSTHTIKKFRLGFASKEGGPLEHHLKQQGFSQDDLIEVGLFRKSDRQKDSTYAFFRNRVLFPITNRQGHVIAFGGRYLGDAKAHGVGKYINSPDTSLFDKGHTLYNYRNARLNEQDNQSLLLVEGYMDAIMLAQHGYGHVVAPLGTALTESQIILCWSISSTPVLLFDGDVAGQRAAYRALERCLPLLATGKTLKFAFVPLGHDPDSLARTQGIAAIKALVQKAVPMTEMIWRFISDQYPITTEDDRALFEKNLFAFLDPLKDTQLKRAYKDGLWQRLRLRNRYPSTKRFAKGSTKAYQNFIKTLDGAAQGNQDFNRQKQLTLILLLMNHPNLTDSFSEALEKFPFDTDLVKFKKALQNFCASGIVDKTLIRNHLTLEGFSEILSPGKQDQLLLLAGQCDPEVDDSEPQLLVEHILAQEELHGLMSDLKSFWGENKEDSNENTLAHNEERFLAHADELERFWLLRNQKDLLDTEKRSKRQEMLKKNYEEAKTYTSDKNSDDT